MKISTQILLFISFDIIFETTKASDLLVKVDQEQPLSKMEGGMIIRISSFVQSFINLTVPKEIYLLTEK